MKISVYIDPDERLSPETVAEFTQHIARRVGISPAKALLEIDVRVRKDVRLTGRRPLLVIDGAKMEPSVG